MPREGWDLDLRLADMDKHGIDRQAICATVHTFYYDQEPALGAACAIIQNDEIVAVARRHSHRFVALATLPLQDPQRGRRAGVPWACSACAAPRSAPTSTAATSTSPRSSRCGPRRTSSRRSCSSIRTARFFRGPAHVVLHAQFRRPSVRDHHGRRGAGVRRRIERYPDINFLLCHGGGFLPYQAGRFLRAFKVRGEPKARLRGSPQDSLARLHYDTIVHSHRALEFLLAAVGPRRVLMGSDYPFDMGEFDCATRVEALPIPRADRDAVLGGRAKELLGNARSEMRAARLRRTLAAAAAAHPFYRARFRELGLAPDDVRLLDDLAALPLTRKEDYIGRPGGVPLLRPDDLPADLPPRKSACFGTSPTPPARPAGAVAVLQHRARRLCDLGPGPPLQQGGRSDRERSRGQSLSAGGFPTGAFLSVIRSAMIAGVPVVHGLTGAANSGVQGAQFARRGAGDG